MLRNHALRERVIFFGFTSFFDPLIRSSAGVTRRFLLPLIDSLEMGILLLVGFLVDRFGSRKLLLFGFTAMG
jgi:hypothetical protein